MWVVLVLVLLIIGCFLYVGHVKRKNPSGKPEPKKGIQVSISQPFKQHRNPEITTLAKDPYQLYAYWEIGNEFQETLKNRDGNHRQKKSAYLLQVYDLSENENQPYLEIMINHDEHSRYIEVDKPCHTYQVVLGKKLSDRRFITLAQSNMVTTPSDNISNTIDPEWIPIQPVWEPLLRLHQRQQATVSSAEAVKKGCKSE